MAKLPFPFSNADGPAAGLWNCFVLLLPVYAAGGVVLWWLCHQ